MTSQPSFTIVTPSYNQATFLRCAMRSVLGQMDVGRIEYIVRDGGSTDGSVDVIRSFEPHLASWHSAKDGGQTKALNAGFREATGRWVGWLNSDDYYLPDALHAVQRRFTEPDQPDVVFGYGVTVDENGSLLREDRFDDFSLEAFAQLGFDLHQPALFVRRQILERVLPLDASLRFAMDVDLVGRLAVERARFARIPRFLSAFRLHGASKTSNILAVGQQESEMLRERVRQQVASHLRLRGATELRLRRRMNMLRRGEWRYACFGGALWPSREAKDAALAGRVWSEG